MKQQLEAYFVPTHSLYQRGEHILKSRETSYVPWLQEGCQESRNAPLSLKLPPSAKSNLS